jgi:malate dehydrogenase (oxaloacetate-decarboxylating)(NADP+)
MFDPRVEDKMVAEYAALFFEKRKRRGVTEYEAKKAMRDRNHFGAMMLDQGDGDALISGLTKIIHLPFVRHYKLLVPKPTPVK